MSLPFSLSLDIHTWLPSDLTPGAHHCSSPAIPPLLPAELRRHDSTELPPRWAENSHEAPQLHPCWNIRASAPPCGSPFKLRKAIFSQH
ncbi:hypothetical protein NQZ68_013071 [Dissostichus eleginoides]|nr:hypothetical protein NQZ68_013071 [Dissostichus eleginoides]